MTDILNIASSLENGEVIIYPTDTVYGLGCDPFNETALQKIIDLKGRDAENGLLVIVEDLEMMESYVEVFDVARKLSSQFHPGPLTLILPIKEDVPRLLVGRHSSLGFRIPDNQFCLDLLKEFGKPIVSTSANISGEPTFDTPQEILEQFGEKASMIDCVVDYGKLLESKPSTLIDLSSNTPRLIREGAISRSSLEANGLILPD